MKTRCLWWRTVVRAEAPQLSSTRERSPHQRRCHTPSRDGVRKGSAMSLAGTSAQDSAWAELAR